MLLGGIGVVHQFIEASGVHEEWEKNQRAGVGGPRVVVVGSVAEPGAAPRRTCLPAGRQKIIDL